MHARVILCIHLISYMNKHAEHANIVKYVIVYSRVHVGAQKGLNGAVHPLAMVGSYRERGHLDTNAHEHAHV